MTERERLYFLIGRATADDGLAAKLRSLHPMFRAMIEGKHSKESAEWCRAEGLPLGRIEMVDTLAAEALDKGKAKAFHAAMLAALATGNISSAAAYLAEVAGPPPVDKPAIETTKGKR